MDRFEFISDVDKIIISKKNLNRLVQRVDIDTVVEVESQRTTAILKVNDIGENGISLESRIPYHVGTVLLINFFIPNSNEGVITVVGEVTNTQISEDGKSLKLGIKFIAGNEDSKYELKKYIESQIIDNWYISWLI